MLRPCGGLPDRASGGGGINVWVSGEGEEGGGAELWSKSRRPTTAAGGMTELPATRRAVTEIHGGISRFPGCLRDVCLTFSEHFVKSYVKSSCDIFS